MLKVGRHEQNVMGRVLASIMAEHKSEGSMASLVNTSGLTAKNIIALESADASTMASTHTSLRNTKTSIQSLFKRHIEKIVLESADGETIEGNEEAGVQDGLDAELS